MTSLLADALFAFTTPFKPTKNVREKYQNFPSDPDLCSFLEWFDKIDVTVTEVNTGSRPVKISPGPLAWTLGQCTGMSGQWKCQSKLPEKSGVVSLQSCEPPGMDDVTETRQMSMKGKVTSIADDHGLINDHIFFHAKNICGFGNSYLPSVGDSVTVQAEQTREGGGWVALSVSLTKEEEKGWNEEPDLDFRIPTVHEERGQMIGEVTSIEEDKAAGSIAQVVTFALKDTINQYKPQVGDWVQATVSKGSIAIDVKPLRMKELTGTVAYIPRVDKGRVYEGTINDDICFDKAACNDGYSARKGDTVAVTAIESKQASTMLPVVVSSLNQTQIIVETIAKVSVIADTTKVANTSEYRYRYIGRLSWRATSVKFIGRSAKKNMNTPAQRSGAWVLRGDQPDSMTNNPTLPSFLPAFKIPDSLRNCVKSGGDVLKLYAKLKEPLSVQNFSERFSALLFLEELAMEEEILSFSLQNVSLTCKGEFLALNVPGISDGKPGLFIGDIVILKRAVASGTFEAMNDAAEHHGFIHHIVMETEELLIRFHDQLHNRFEETDLFDATFTYSRLPYRRCHLAIKHAEKKYAKDLLFPLFKNSTTIIYRKKSQTTVQLTQNVSESTKSSPVGFFNPCLNDRQKSAVQRILHGEARPKPYILFGPPGTGKTVTLVETILQIITHVASSRLLVCAPSNSAVDLLCERLHDSGKVNTKTMVRFNAFRRPPQAVAERIRQYCHPDEPLAVTARYKVVLTTCVNSGQFYILSLRSDHFTHVYVDEAGQANEPECLIPIGLGSRGQVVLTGDPEQLGSVLKSPYALHYGLGLSLLERLMLSSEYSRNIKLHKEGYNPLIVTKLINNYRSHPALLVVSSALFYDNELQYCSPKSLSHSLCDWEHLPQKGFPLVFHGISGSQLREENSPSWFNACEIVQASRYVKLLLGNDENNCTTDDIGIITPYKKQVEKMRMMLKALQVEGLKVGSVEEFQGQERKVIILSTVRSTSAERSSSDDSVLSALGFVANSKRFNVAITRAKALMIVIGNPFVLAKDKYWMTLLEHAFKNKGYIGCDISSLMKSS